MRILLILIVLGVIGAGAYYSDSDVREKVRGYQVSDSDRDRFEAYKEGKALFKASWSDASRGEFKVWGDDPSETATAVPGKTGIWLARGNVTVDSSGTKTDEQWCIAFDRINNRALGKGLVGNEATEALRKFDSPQEQKPTAGVPVPGRGTPAAGSWMWSKEGRTSLDQGPYKSKPH